MNSEVTNYIQNSAEEQVGILKDLRALVFSVVPNVNEQFKWGRPVYGLEKDFCYLATTKKHVTFGFFKFEKVITNKNLIEGTGKDMRHIKINKASQIVEYQLSKMIEEVLK